METILNSLNLKTERFILENGKIISGMGGEHKFGLMDHFTKASGRMIVLMEEDDLSTPMGTFMKASG